MLLFKLGGREQKYRHFLSFQFTYGGGRRKVMDNPKPWLKQKQPNMEQNGFNVNFLVKRCPIF
jgi:hypothetical protein